MLLSQIRLTFYDLYSGMPCFIALLMTIFVLFGMGFINIGEISHGRISLSSVLLLLLVSFVSWFKLELIYIYIPHRKHQVKPHSSPCFSVACVAAIVHRNYFFRFYQKYKSSDSKAKFRQASNH